MKKFSFSPAIKLWMKNLGRSLVEWLINFIFSTLPLWLGAFALAVIDRGDNNLLNSYLNKWPLLYSKGELFGYSIAALAPVIYITIKLRKEVRYSNMATVLLFISIIVAILSSVVIAISLSNTQFNNISTLPLSFIIFWFCFILLYMAIFINNQANPEIQIRDANESLSKESQDFASQFRGR